MPLSTTVVLCTCNGARFLDAQWDSLLAQSPLPDEIVVRDDASSDATTKMLEYLRQRAEDRGVRVRLVRNPDNLGFVTNFEAALADARGDVLLLCDQDDVWHADKLATLVAEFERRPELLLLCSDARRIDEAGVDLRRSLFDVLRVSHTELRRMHVGQGFGVLLRRSLATGATIALRRSLLDVALPFPDGWVHDEWLAIVAAACGGFDCLERPLIDYRQHASNQIGMPDRNLLDKWRDLRRPRAAMIGHRIRRGEALQQWLQGMGRRVNAACVDQVVQQLKHLRARGELRGRPWSRMGRVMNETFNGHYRRYSAGWHTAVRDLVRRC